MFEVTSTDSTFAPFVYVTHGASTRRNIRIRRAERVHVDGGVWEGGSRTDYRFAAFRYEKPLMLIERMTMPGLEDAHPATPFGGAMAGYAPLRPGTACVEHSIFQGKDIGYTITLHPDDYDMLDPQICRDHDDCKQSTEMGRACKSSQNQVTPRDKSILTAFRSLKAGPYRQEELARLKFTQEDRTRLAAKGLVKVSSNGATRITPEGRIACA